MHICEVHPYMYACFLLIFQSEEFSFSVRQNRALSIHIVLWIIVTNGKIFMAMLRVLTKINQVLTNEPVLT
jgi:hypothetical protein